MAHLRKEAARMPYGPPLDIGGECLLTGFVTVGDAFVVTTPEGCQSQSHPAEEGDITPPHRGGEHRTHPSEV